MSTLPGFLDELTKISASSERLKVPKIRSGRRSMRVDTLLKKEKDGSFYKDASGDAESYVPWYGTALGGTSGALAGQRFLPTRYKTLGALGGTLLGTAAGLHGGEALGRSIDAHRTKVGSELKKLKPGDVPTLERNSEITNPEVQPHGIVVQKLAYIEAFSDELLKISNFNEIEKEALLSALFRNKNRIVNLGNEVIDLNPQSRFSYSNIGKKVQSLGNMYRPATTVEAARAVGSDKGALGRIAGETMSSAGHHMQHASGVSKVLNPLGKPIGGAIEGAIRGTGQEAARAGAQRFGGVLQRAAPTMGAVGELGAGVGSMMGAGQALSPAAHLIGQGLQHTGLASAGKAAFGKLGITAIKDVGAAALEKGLERAPQAIRAAGAVVGKTVPAMARAVA